MYYVRWRVGESRVGRTFPTLTRDHPAYDEDCPACGVQFGDFAPVTLLVLGPGGDDEERDKFAAGRWCNAVAILVHAECLGLEVPNDDA